MLRVRGLVFCAVVLGFGCNPYVATDAGVEAGVDAGPEVCVAFPERLTADYTVEKGCWLVLKTPVLSAGITVTMKPGAKLVFSAGTRLTIADDQALSALGTEEEPILLTASSPVRGHWKGLTFEGTATASHLDYVTIEYGGDTTSDAAGAGVKLIADSRGVRVGFSHTTFRENQGYGVWMTGSAVLPEFTANVLTKNGLGPASVDSETVGRFDATSTFTGNDKDEVIVRAYRLGTSATWDDLGVPYHLQSDLASLVSELTLRPGVRLIMPPEAALSFSGDGAALIAEGTAEKPIVFTGETQARGAWEGIVFSGSNNTRNLLRYVTVEYAGNTSSDVNSACVLATSDSHGVQVKLDHVTLRQCQGWGLRLGGNAVVPVFTANVLTQNALGPAMVDSNAVHQLVAGSTFTGNDVDEIRVDAQWVTSTVTWHDVGVPYVLNDSVRPQAVWTLEPGVTLEMMPMTSIRVGGGDDVGFHAAGTAAKPVTITGTVKTPGSWDGVMFDGTLNGANSFEYAVVEYGGGGTRFGWLGMINSTSDSHGVNVSVTNSTIRNSAGWGIWLNSAQTGSVTDNTYAGNASGDYFKDP